MTDTTDTRISASMRPRHKAAENERLLWQYRLHGQCFNEAAA